MFLKNSQGLSNVTIYLWGRQLWITCFILIIGDLIPFHCSRKKRHRHIQGETNRPMKKNPVWCTAGLALSRLLQIHSCVGDYGRSCSFLLWTISTRISLLTSSTVKYIGLRTEHHPGALHLWSPSTEMIKRKIFGVYAPSKMIFFNVYVIRGSSQLSIRHNEFKNWATRG